MERVAYRADKWQIQEVANEWQLAEESDDDGEEITGIEINRG